MAKIGAGHAKAMFRKGAVELGQYLPAFNSAGTFTTEDAGVWPNSTQGEIAKDRRTGKTEDVTMQNEPGQEQAQAQQMVCLLYTSPSPRDRQKSRMPSSA